MNDTLEKRSSKYMHKNNLKPRELLTGTTIVTFNVGQVAPCPLPNYSDALILFQATKGIENLLTSSLIKIAVITS